MTSRAAWMVCGVAMLAGACDSGDDDEFGFDDAEEVSLRMVQDNGFNLNGFNLNGFNLNGFNLNGFNLNGAAGTTDYIKPIEFKHDGVVVPQVWLTGSEIKIKQQNGVVLGGAAVGKLKIKYELRVGGSTKNRTVRLNNATQLAPGSDVWFYDLDIKENGDWSPLCVDGGGQKVQAIMLADVWNPKTGDRSTPTSSAVTYACRGTALAKCVEWGYKPWTSASGTSLYDFHQACSRMVRADYCGDGIPHTINGTPIHVLDQKGVQVKDPNVTYVVEAEWGPDGAVCLNGANTRLPDQSIECQIPACGASFSSGGVIQSGKVLSGP